MRERLIEDRRRLREMAQRMPKANKPKHTRCNRCGDEIIVASKRKGELFALDTEPSARGKWELRQGVAYPVKPEDAEGRVRYKAHAERCWPGKAT
jgi:hypothetical protein